MVASPAAQWRYIGNCSDERLQALQEARRFDEITTQIVENMDFLCGHICECCDRNGFHRVVFCVLTSYRVFDAFFNSVSGYRAQFFRSPEIGYAANRHLIDTATPQLLSSVRSQFNEDDSVRAVKSLAAPSAKAWLAENTLELCDECKGEWNATSRAKLTIENDRWEHNQHAHATWGQQAYNFSKIRFIGGFLNDQEEEYVALHKERRVLDIHERGWS